MNGAGRDMLHHRRLLRYGLVGVLTAAIHYGVLWALVEAADLGPTAASSLGFLLAVIFNYFMHYRWTFATSAPHGRTVVRYLLMIGCGFVLNALVMYTGVQGWGGHYLLVQLLAFAVVISWNFTASSLWVFRD